MLRGESVEIIIAVTEVRVGDAVRFGLLSSNTPVRVSEVVKGDTWTELTFQGGPEKHHTILFQNDCKLILVSRPYAQGREKDDILWEIACLAIDTHEAATKGLASLELNLAKLNALIVVYELGKPLATPTSV